MYFTFLNLGSPLTCPNVWEGHIWLPILDTMKMIRERVKALLVLLRSVYFSSWQAYMYDNKKLPYKLCYRLYHSLLFIIIRQNHIQYFPIRRKHWKKGERNFKGCFTFTKVSYPSKLGSIIIFVSLHSCDKNHSIMDSVYFKYV